MTSDLCGEDVVVQISQPQLMSHAAGTGVATASARVHATSAAVELGRRLLQAARAGDTPLVRHLMAKGAPFTTDWVNDLTSPDYTSYELGTSPLHLAAWGGHLSTCSVLVRAGVSRDARTKVDRTPLHLAAHAGHAAVAALLLDHGASPHARDMLQMTPLHWAAERGHAACAAVLCAAGADLHATCKFRRTPRTLAAARGHESVLRVLDDAAAQRSTPAAAATEQTNKEGATSLKTEPVQVSEIHEEIPSKQDQRFQSIKIETPKERVSVSDEAGAGVTGGSDASMSGGEGGGGAGAALLRRHGITLLADEPPATVLSALHSGRTLVLSDAGKLMLKESEGAVVGKGGVVVRARAVRGAARGGKTFLLSVGNKLVTERGAHQVKRGRGAAGSGAGVRIVVNRAQLSRLAPGVTAVPAVPVAPDVPGPPDVTVVSGDVQQSAETTEESDSATLRAQLASAHAALRTVLAQLDACRARLQRYEPL